MRKIRIAAALLVIGGATFMLSAGASAATFSNPGAIAINGSSTVTCPPGEDEVGATPYPSQIQISGQQGTVSDVNVTIDGFSHPEPGDLRMLLVGPQGQSALLMHEAGADNPASNAVVTFDDAASTTLPEPIVTGTYKPTQTGEGCAMPLNEPFPAPAPGGPYGSDLSGFNGSGPNGIWSLYVVDWYANLDGSISGGWSLDLAGITPAPTGRRAAALKNCRKRARKHNWSRKHLRKCKRKAKLRPV